MRLLFVIDNLSTGGAQRQMVNLAVGLKKRGHDVHFFCYAPGDLLAGPILAENIPITVALKKTRFSFKVIFALRRLMINGNFDLVLSFLDTPNLYSILAGHMVPKRPCLVVSERNNDFSPLGMISRLVRQAYRMADHLVVNSYSQEKNFIDHYPWLKNSISTIYNGYDLDVFIPSEVVRENQPLKLIVIASALPRKNGLCLVEALKILRSDYRLCPLVSWVGQQIIPGDIQRYYTQMVEAIAEAQVNDQWHWMGQRNDIVALLHQHDALVLPSFGEGLPNVVCEALACGRPVIVSNVYDHPRLVQNGVSGFLFDWRDPANLARTIHAFSNLTVYERQEMGAAGRRFAERNLSITRFVQDYEALFNRLIS